MSQVHITWKICSWFNL